jgi:alcohol dehydrogenase, propanol-preferring
MGLRVVAVDTSDDKLDIARQHGAELTVNASHDDPVATIRASIGGAHASLVTATSTRAFEQAVGMLRPGGTTVYVGLPGAKADEVRTSIAAVVGGELTIRGSSVGTRHDLREAVDFAIRGLVAATTHTVGFDDVSDTFAAMRAGTLLGRAVLIPS